MTCIVVGVACVSKWCKWSSARHGHAVSLRVLEVVLLVECRVCSKWCRWSSLVTDVVWRVLCVCARRDGRGRRLWTDMKPTW